jgi:hypothetical protein
MKKLTVYLVIASVTSLFTSTMASTTMIAEFPPPNNISMKTAEFLPPSNSIASIFEDRT